MMTVETGLTVVSVSRYRFVLVFSVGISIVFVSRKSGFIIYELAVFRRAGVDKHERMKC